jgi:HlyD family secretion protein
MSTTRLLCCALPALLLGLLGCRTDPNSLVLAGTIETRTVEVGSLVGGRIAAVEVHEGDVVQAGQPIVLFEPDLLDLQIAEQRAEIAQLKAALTRTEVGPRREDREQLRVDYENAETQRKRQQALLAGGAVSQQSYDDADARAKKALEALRAAERGGRREDVSSSQAQLAAAVEHIAYLERQRRELAVTAPAAGIVQTIDLRPGDLVGANAPVATLLEPDQIWVRVYVPEPKLGLVHLGAAAAIAVDSFPNQRFPGKVVEIRSQAEFTPRNVQTLDQRNDQVFGVKVEIPPGAPLKPGMAATVTLDLRTSPPAKLAPPARHR